MDALGIWTYFRLNHHRHIATSIRGRRQCTLHLGFLSQCKHLACPQPRSGDPGDIVRKIQLVVLLDPPMYKDHHDCTDHSHPQGFIQAFPLTTSSRLSYTTRTAHLLGDPHRSPSPTKATVKICKQHCNREQIDSTLISHM